MPDSHSDTPFDNLTQSEPTDSPSSHDEKIEELVLQLKETADKLLRDRAGRGDLKLLTAAFKELRYCFKVFGGYRGIRKVTVFGSARTRPNHPAYQAAVDFSKRMTEEGFMVITGAAQGIMEAGHVGA
ncbi:MAG: hypothetical protein LC104_01690, partial [Bacteroidales bacterium]|nr:hypothetical protein [Bacteroidales bacterium]